MIRVVIARDGDDTEAKARRAAVRPTHLERIGSLVEAGNILVGGAILDDEGEMVGSVLLTDFETQEAFDDWIQNDPYVTGEVWKEIEVQPYRPAIGAWMPAS
jgi:uncharacterized protein YciI